MKKKVVKKSKKVTKRLSNKVKKVEITTILKSLDLLGLLSEPKPKLRDFWGLFPKVKNHCFQDMMGETNYLDEFQELVETMPEDQFNSLMHVEESYYSHHSISLNDSALRKLKLNKYKQEFKYLFKLIDLEKNGRVVDKNPFGVLTTEKEETPNLVMPVNPVQVKDLPMQEIKKLISLIETGANELSDKIEVKDPSKLVFKDSVKFQVEHDIFEKYTKPNLYMRMKQQLLMYTLMFVVNPLQKVAAWSKKSYQWLVVRLNNFDNYVLGPTALTVSKADLDALSSAINKVCRVMEKQSKELNSYREKEMNDYKPRYHRREAASICSGSFRRTS